MSLLGVTGKYVVFKRLNDISLVQNKLVIFMFGAAVTHKAFVAMLGQDLENVDSAGYVRGSLTDSGQPCIECYGESLSLNSTAKPERDSTLANEVFDM